jgi:MOSC domain-containing protein YiiM
MTSRSGRDLSLDRGTIVQINVSFGGLPKRAVPQGVVGPLGIEGDFHNHPQIHGGPRKAVLIVASEVVDELTARGYPLFYGALGENLTTRGLAIRDIRMGDQIRAGSALLEITQPRGPCSQLDVYGPALKNELTDDQVRAGDYTSPRWGISGFYAKVLSPGQVQPDDIIAVVAKFA